MSDIFIGWVGERQDDNINFRKTEDANGVEVA
jgi:hypothetical protein